MAVLWLADVLRAAGLRVVEYPGWRARAAPGVFTPRAVMWHHDASAPGPSPNVPRVIAEIGNSSTPPPLAQAWVDTAGVWVLTAAGRCNHAGLGGGWGRIPAGAGNTYAIGVETDHTVGEPWPAAQLAGLRRGTAAILAELGVPAADALCGHKEYAPVRKVDPDGLDMAAERRLVEEDDMPVTPDEVRAIARAVLDVDLGGGWTLADAARALAVGEAGKRSAGAAMATLGGVAAGVANLAARPDGSPLSFTAAELAEELVKAGVGGVPADLLAAALDTAADTLRGQPL